MTPTTLLTASAQYLYVTLSATVLGVPFDPTSLPVAVAIEPDGTPPSAFHTAAWVHGAPIPTVQILVGPGGVELDAGDYDVYVQLTNPPETPVIPGGPLWIRDTQP